MKLLKANEISFFDFGEIEIVLGKCIHSFPVHVHNSMCVVMINSGKAEVILGGYKVTLDKGDVLIVPPYCPHTISPVDDSPYEYLTVCVKNKKNIAQKANNRHYTVMAKSYIENRLADAAGLQALSALFHISKYHFSREFKKVLGMPPHQFCLQEKVKRAKEGIIAQNGAKLSEMALSLGFSDQSHLCNTFKRFMGVTPLQYRDQYKCFYNKAGENVAKM